MKKGFAIGRMSKGEMKIESLQDETILLLSKNNEEVQPVFEEEYEEPVQNLSDLKEEEVVEIPEFIRNRRNLYRATPRREEHTESFMQKLLNRIGGKR